METVISGYFSISFRRISLLSLTLDFFVMFSNAQHREPNDDGNGNWLARARAG